MKELKLFIENVLSSVLFLLIIVIMAVSIIFFAIYSAYEIGWGENDFLYLIILWIISVAGVLISCLKEFAINSVSVFQGILSGDSFIYFPGSHLISPIRKLFKSFATEKHLEVQNKGDAPAQGDKMSFSYEILFVIDIDDENTREQNVRKYLGSTEANIKAALKLTADSTLIDWIYAQPSADAAKKNKKDALTRSTFENECIEYGIRIVQVKINDLDFSQETQEAIKAKRAMEGFNDAVDTLMKGSNPPATVAQAHKIVKAKMLPNYKEFEFTNQGGGNPPILINEK